MTLPEMHVYFRQYAQQMGMQNVRAILPDQIDILINTSITDIVNQVITKHIATTSAGAVTTNSKLGQLNTLKNLYKIKYVDVSPNENMPFSEDRGSILRLYGEISTFSNTPTRYYKIEEKVIDDTTKYICKSVNQSVYDSCSTKDAVGNEEKLINYANKSYKNWGIMIPSDNNSIFDYFYMIGLSICYTLDEVYTSYFPIRMIDDIYLADTLNDFALKPTPESPIAVIYNGKLDLYIGALINDSLVCNLVPSKLRISYIEKPATVQYDVSNPTNSTNCNLPDYTHVDIIKHAVDLYRISTNNSIFGDQIRSSQNQGIVRNNITPNAENYQS